MKPLSAEDLLLVSAVNRRLRRRSSPGKSSGVRCASCGGPADLTAEEARIDEEQYRREVAAYEKALARPNRKRAPVAPERRPWFCKNVRCFRLYRDHLHGNNWDAIHRSICDLDHGPDPRAPAREMARLKRSERRRRP